MNISINGNSNLISENKINKRNSEVNNVETEFDELLSKSAENSKKNVDVYENSVSKSEDVAVNNANITDNMSTEDYMKARNNSRSVEFDNISTFRRTEAEQAEYDKVMNEILGIDPSQKEEEVLISFDELTTEQKEELKNIIGDPNETNGYTQEKLDEYLQKLVEFKVITKLDAGYYGGHLTILYTDNNGDVINTRDSDIAISNNRDNWNGSIVEWFKQLERDVRSKLMLFGDNENYTDAVGTVHKEIDRIKGMQELMEELFAEENI